MHNSLCISAQLKKILLNHEINMQKQEKTIIDFNTGETKNLNDNFTQFYNENMHLVMKIAKENSNAMRMFFWIVQHMDNRNALVVSHGTLADALKVHRNTIINCTKYLREVKAIEVFKSGATNVYAVNKYVCWKNSADNKKYAMFGATVYISDTEQEAQSYKTDLRGHAIPKKQKKIKNIVRSGIDQ